MSYAFKEATKICGVIEAKDKRDLFHLPFRM
jgi:hypothetical protein